MSPHGRSHTASTTSDDSRSQSNVVAVVLLIALTLVGTTAILALGGMGLTAQQEFVESTAAEQGLSTLDSAASTVALGDSPSQQVRLSRPSAGSYSVHPSRGTLTIVHRNYANDGDEETLAQVPLGTVVYEQDGDTIALQGNGVWRSSGNGSTMVSPPPVHYRGNTLTMPLVNVASGSAGGGATATVESLGAVRRIHPNASATYEPGIGYTNPVENGTVVIKVQSDYYEGWASYFRTRTSGEVEVFHGNQTATLELVSLGTTGEFQMPLDGNSVRFDLAGGHPISEFSLTLFDDDGDSANFNNLQWSLYTEQGSRQLEFHIRPAGGPTCGKDVELTIYYSETGGTTYQSWHDDTAGTIACGDFDGDGSDEQRLVLNFTDDETMQYTSLGGQVKIQHFKNDAGSFESSAEFDAHSGSVPWEPATFTSSGNRTRITNHYLSRFGPQVELTVDDKSSDTVNEAASRGHIDADHGAGKFLQYLHVTENRIRVTLE